MQRELRIFLVFIFMLACFPQVALSQYKARPTISTLDPTAGPPGAKVRIVGSDFGPEYKVFFGGIELAPLRQTETEIEVQLPENAVQGRFTLKGPIHQVVSPQVFWVVQPQVAPIITDIEPLAGPPGTAVTITGKHFSKLSHENLVTLNGQPMSLRSATSTRIVAVVPAGAKPGNIEVKVYNAGNATSPQKFGVLEQLKIDSVSPNGGPPGTKVTLVGSGFSAKRNGNRVTLNGKPCKILRMSSTELVVQIPANGAESGKFAVDVKEYGRAESQAVFPVAYPPEIKGFEPLAGGIGREIAIQGNHFGNTPKAVEVLLSGRKCPILGVTDEEVRVVVPDGAVSGPLEVVVAGMGSAVSQQAFDVWAPLAVTRMEPRFGLPGTEVSIWGTGFRADASAHSVMIGNKAVAVDRIEEGALIFKIPNDAPSGKISLSLEVKDRGTTNIAMPLQVAHSPQIVDFFPKRGPAGSQVTISGSNFGSKVNHVRVLLGNRVATVTKVQPNSITLSVPEGATSGKLEIQTVRRGKVQSNQEFEVYVPVQVTNFLPSMGYSGQVVNLFGSGFDMKAKRNIVKIGGTKVKVVEASPTRLKVKLPPNVQPGKFRVEVASRGYSETALAFNVVERLEISSFSPQVGPPGTYVYISGKGFSNKGLRGYLGQKPIGVRVDSPTKAIIAIPKGSVDGPLVFTAPGAGRADSRQVFKVLAPLTVTGFQPRTGEPGTRVAIYGTGFDLRPKMTQVFYGPNILKLEPGSHESMLIVTIPEGATNSSFRVTVKDRGQVESEDIFAVYKQVNTPAPAPIASAPAPIASAPAPLAAAAPAQTIAPSPQTQTPAAVTPPQAAPKQSTDDVVGESKGTINRFEPDKAPMGEIVTIYGSGFGEDITKVKVWVGQVPANVVGVVPDMIMIEVPVGVNRGKVRVQVGATAQMVSKEFLLITE